MFASECGFFLGEARRIVAELHSECANAAAVGLVTTTKKIKVMPKH